MRVCGWLTAAGCLWLVLVPARLPGVGTEVKVVNLEKLNSEADEDDPCALPDGITLLYAKKVGGTFDIYLSRRNAAGQPWPAGKPFLNSKEYDERTPFFHKATAMLYYAINQVPDGTNLEDKNFDIVRKIAETAPVPLQGISTGDDELSPWVTPGGKEFYFSRATRKGWILYVAEGPKPGPIGGAKPVGFPPGFHRATLTDSALQMYLQGPLEGHEGKTALYRSRRAKLGTVWSKPELVPGLGLSEGKYSDTSPSLSPDGSRLYFASDRPGGKGGLDLWSVLTAQLK
jgi:hypothetical protein